MLSALAMALSLVMGGAVVTLAAGGYGSQDDPLVTLSYITDVAVPEANAQINSIFSQKQAAILDEVTKQVNQMRTDLAGKITPGSPVSQDVLDQVANAAAAQLGSGSSTAQWRSVSLAKGQTIYGALGAQLILRKGSATCYSGMVNLSSGDTLSHGQSVAANNLYLIGTEGCGFTATADCTVLVNGGNTIQ